MVMSPAGLETKNKCAGEGQQQFSSQSDNKRGREYRSRGIPNVESRYLATPDEDTEALMFWSSDV
jgi:hypothetical protein